MARPRDQDRRRRELVAATLRVVARRGLSGVRLRDVADEAGITSGAVLYYYENLDELFFAAYERAIERFCRDREQVVAAMEDPAAALATALGLGVPTGTDDAEIRLLYEFEAVAMRSPACAELMASYVERQVAMYAALLERGAEAGVFAPPADARMLARNLVAVEDGHGIYVLTGQVPPADVLRLLLEQGALAAGLPVERLVPENAPGSKKRRPAGRRSSKQPATRRSASGS
jgi:DNA-binding transcriptional regulator YbjK